MRCRPFLIVMLSILASLPCAPAAHAQRPEDEAQAEVLFTSGLQLMDEGRTSGACIKFEASMRLSPTSGAALALGNCYEVLGRTASAFGTFSEAQRLAQAENRPRHLDAAHRRMEALAPQLKTIAIQLAPGLKLGTTLIQLDGQRLGPDDLGLDRPLDPGMHTIEAKADGFEPFRKQVDVSDRSITVTINMERPAPPPEPPPLPPAPPPPVAIVEPVHTLNVRLHEDAPGPVQVTLETAKGEMPCPAVKEDTPCKLRNVTGSEAVVHATYKGAHLDKTIDLHSDISTVQIITGNSPNGALVTFGILGLLGGLGTGAAAIVTSSMQNSTNKADSSGPDPKDLATIAAISGGAGLLFLILGYSVTTPYVKMVGPTRGDSIAQASRISPVLDWHIGSSHAGADAASRVTLGMAVNF